MQILDAGHFTQNSVGQQRRRFYEQRINAGISPQLVGLQLNLQLQIAAQRHPRPLTGLAHGRGPETPIGLIVDDGAAPAYRGRIPRKDARLQPIVVGPRYFYLLLQIVVGLIGNGRIVQAGFDLYLHPSRRSWCRHRFPPVFLAPLADAEVHLADIDDPTQVHHR